MTYDHWKTTEPEPFEEDRPADDEPELYECDCCGKKRELLRVFFTSIETWACDECRGDK